MRLKLLGLSVACLTIITLHPAQSSFDTPNDWFEQYCNKILSSDEEAAEFIHQSIFAEFPHAESDGQGQLLDFVNSLGHARLKLGGAPVSCSFGYRGEIGGDLVGLIYVLNYPAKPVLLYGHFRLWEGEWQMYAFDVVTESLDYPYVWQ